MTTFAQPTHRKGTATPKPTRRERELEKALRFARLPVQKAAAEWFGTHAGDVYARTLRRIDALLAKHPRKAK